MHYKGWLIQEAKLRISSEQPSTNLLKPTMYPSEGSRKVVITTWCITRIDVFERTSQLRKDIKWK